MKLGKYTLHETLGRGSFGTVYRAYDTVLEVERAVKILHPALLTDPDFIERFRREGRLAARLDHPNIVPVYDLDEASGQFFLAMKYMSGGSLNDLLKKSGPLSYPRAVELLAQIAAGLDFAHRQGIIHRDIKPANILLDADGTPRVGDFGFASALSATGLASTLSGSGGLVGTPAYIAPELWRNKPASPASDVYSVACVFYEMLTGKVLFDGESLAEVIRHIIDGPKLPAQWPVGTPPGVTALLQRALAQKPEDRFQTAGAFSQAACEEVDALPPKPGKNKFLLTGGILGLAGILIILCIGAAIVGINIWNNLDTLIAPPQSVSSLQATKISLSTPTVAPTQPQPTLPPTEPAQTPAPNATPTLLGGSSGKFAFFSEREGNYEICVMDVDGDNLNCLTNNTVHDSSPAWSPDGKRIAFTSERDGNFEIYVMNADGSNLTRLTNYDSKDMGSSWSPDGKQITFTSDRDGNYEIYVMNIDGSNPIRLTDDPHADYDPAWSPDGKKIVFQSDRDGNDEIYVINVDGSDPTRLTNDIWADWDPAWSPDGEKIAFQSWRDSHTKIFVMNADGSNPICLTKHSNDDWGPTWSPDGNWIAYQSDMNEVREIYIMIPDGSNITRLTYDTYDDWAPAWAP